MDRQGTYWSQQLEKEEMMNNRPDLRHYKERVTSAPADKETVERDELDVTPEQMDELREHNEGVLHKLTLLEDEIARTTNKTIPVNDRAFEVKKALRALYPESSDTFITFDQYKRSLAYKASRYQIDSSKIVKVITGNAELDSRLLTEAQWEASDEVYPHELAIIAGQYLLCMVANRIMQPYSAQNMQQVAAPKIYPGTETAPATAQILIGLAALLLQVAQNREEVVGLLEETMKDAGETLAGMTADELVSQATEQGRDELLTKFDKSKNPYYQDVISRYCCDYVRNSSDPGYEGWVAQEAVVSNRSDADQTVNEMAAYTGDTMGINMYRAMTAKTSDINTQLDYIAAALRSKPARDMLCCFVSFVGSLPTLQLKLYRTALEFAANGVSFDLSSNMAAVSLRVNTFLSEQILEPVLHALDKFYRKFTGPLLSLLDRDNWPNPETYDIVMLCTPVDESIEYALIGLELLKKNLENSLRMMWRRLEVKSIKGRTTWRLLADCRMAKILLKLVDTVNELVEQGNLCARNDGTVPSIDEMETVTATIAGTIPESINVPTGGDPYKTFSPKPIVAKSGISMGGVEDSKSDAQPAMRTSDCIRQFANLLSMANVSSSGAANGANKKDSRAD